MRPHVFIPMYLSLEITIAGLIFPIASLILQPFSSICRRASNKLCLRPFMLSPVIRGFLACFPFFKVHSQNILLLAIITVILEFYSADPANHSVFLHQNAAMGTVKEYLHIHLDSLNLLLSARFFVPLNSYRFWLSLLFCLINSYLRLVSSLSLEHIG